MYVGLKQPRGDGERYGSESGSEIIHNSPRKPFIFLRSFVSISESFLSLDINT